MSTDELLKSIDRLEPGKSLALLDKSLKTSGDERLRYARGILLYGTAWINHVLDGFADSIGWSRSEIRARSWLASTDGAWALTDAIQSLGQALAANPRLAKIRYLLGRAQEQAGDLAAAEQSYRQCLELVPRITFAQYHLARLCERRGDEDAALVLYEKIYTEHQDFIEAKIAAADIIRRRDRPVAAAKLYASALTVPRAFFNARWRILSQVNLDEPVPVEDDYKGYVISFVHDHFVGTPIPPPPPPPPPPRTDLVTRLKLRLVPIYHRTMSAYIPHRAKVVIHAVVGVLLATEQRLRQPHQRPVRAVNQPLGPRLQATRLHALKAAIDRVSR